MARLNTRISSTRSSTADSLYRDPTPVARTQSHAPGAASRHSSYSVVSPSTSFNSDKENDIPDSRQNTPKPVPSARRPMNPPRLPTPVSGSGTRSQAGNGNKRRRTDDHSMEASSPTSQWNEGDSEIQITGAAVSEYHQSPTPFDEDGDDEDGSKYYNPGQDVNERRQLRANIRKNHRAMEDNRDELIKNGNTYLRDHIRMQDQYMKKVRQTADAALDARAMVLASDLAYKKIQSSLNGNNGIGIDVDQFVSRCIFFMNSGGNHADVDNNSRSTHCRNTFHQEDDENDIGDGLDWAVLGRAACFPNNRRPPVSGFLLGPLSVQRRVRATQRRARSQRQPVGTATQPQELSQADIKQSETSNLTHMVKTINAQLMNHIRTSSAKCDEEFGDLEEDAEIDEKDIDAAFRRNRIQQTAAGEAAVSLFDFAVNPHSFGQTVENLFYVSFLIREGNASIEEDKAGLPLLVPSEPYSVEEQREKRIEKRQAVFRIDWSTWEDLIEAFDIKEPLITHREVEETNISSGGWYG